jgi:uncharacterized RDD family membrane protein YckC
MNPFAPPAETSEPFEDADDGTMILAERGTRFGAAFIDGLLLWVGAIPGIIAFSTLDILRWRMFEREPTIAGALLWVCMLPVAAYQWSLIARTGQSLGKRWLGIKIVKVDGSSMNFVSGVVLRVWITTLIGFIPMVGSLINFVGILFIFGSERRCLHDLIAGTRVVVAPFRG